MNTKPERLYNRIRCARKGAARVRWLVILISVLLLGAVMVPIGLSYKRMTDARYVVANAQSVRTAAYATALERIKERLPLGDQTGEGGFAKGVQELILTTAMVPGDLWLLRVDESGYNIEEFLYVEDGYAVRFLNGQNGTEDQFVSYRVDYAITPQRAYLSGLTAAAAEGEGGEE